jgi:hypothetical protein
MRRTAIPYRDAVKWILDNDDVTFLDDEYGSPSVSACLVADIYQRPVEEVVAEMRQRRGSTR